MHACHIMVALLCTDIDECRYFFSDNICDGNAECVNTHGSFICECKRGFNGTGKSCEGKAIIFSIYQPATVLLNSYI